eukprot:10853677-Heterocapsa_arctica.AAC.1
MRSRRRSRRRHWRPSRMGSSSGGPSGMSCCECPNSGDQVAAAGAQICTIIAHNHPSAGGDPTWGRTCM